MVGDNDLSLLENTNNHPHAWIDTFYVKKVSASFIETLRTVTLSRNHKRDGCAAEGMFRAEGAFLNEKTVYRVPKTEGACCGCDLRGFP